MLEGIDIKEEYVWNGFNLISSLELLKKINWNIFF